jgi:lipoyl(octanoyl) transferase
MGKNGNSGNLLWDDKQLNERGIAFYPTNRGGDATYHGPGQIVAYPILDLDHFFGDIHLYMRKLEEVVIRVLAEYGITGERSEGETGVWLDAGKPGARKICAMGVHTSRWVTMHGLALNANVELSYYQGIIPCGIKDKGVTSMHKELGYSVDEDQLKKHLLEIFARVFDATIQPLRSD